MAAAPTLKMGRVGFGLLLALMLLTYGVVTLVLDVRMLAGIHTPSPSPSPASPYYAGSSAPHSAIETALLNNDWAQVRALVAADASLLEAQTWRGTTPLIEAARAGELELIDWLLAQGADINHVGQGVSALSEAALYSRWEAVYRLLAKGAAVAPLDRAGGGVSSYNHPVLLAVRAGELDVLRELARLGVALRAPASDGTTALLQAAAAGQLAAAVFLVEEVGMGADEGGDAPGRMTPALEAAYFGHFDVARALLARGGSLTLRAADDAQRAAERTQLAHALHAAARANRLDALAQLVELGPVHVDATDWSGEPALLEAVRAGRAELFDWLLAHGADAGARSERNETALHLAAAHGRAREAAALVARGADAGAVNADGMSAAHYAALAGELAVLAQLAAAEGAAGERVRAQLDAPNARGDTPLLLAARRGHASTCAWLLERGAKAAAVGGKGEGGASLAVRARSYATLSLLLAAGASPTLADATGATPLHRAARVGSAKSVAALAWAVAHGLGREGGVALPEGALELAQAVGHGPGREAVRQAVNARDGKARTPLLLHARTHGRTELARALLELGADPAVAGADGRTAEELMALADARAAADDEADGGR